MAGISFKGKGHIAVIICLLLAWPMCTSLWSITPGASINAFLRVAGLMAIGSAMCLAAGQTVIRNRQALGMAMPISMILVSALLSTEILPGGGLINWFITRIHGDYDVFRDKQVNRGLCALAVLVWPAAMGLASCGKTRVAIAMPIVLFPGIFALHSLSAKTGLIAGCTVFYAICAWPRVSCRALYLLLPLLILCWPLTLRSFESAVRGNPALYESLPESSKHRLDIWQFVRDRACDRPWLGWGMDSSRAIPGGDVVYAPGKVYLPLHPHNNLLHILLEQGMIGYGLSFCALLLILRQHMRLPAQPRMVRATAAALLVSYFTIGMTAFGMWQAWWVATAWLALGLWLLMVRVTAQSPENNL